MDVVSIQNNEGQKVINLPQNFQISERDFYIHKLGSIVFLVPQSDPWSAVFQGLDMFSDDFMENGRGDFTYEKRVQL